MATPQSYLVFRRTLGDLPRTIELSSETLPAVLGATEVLIKIHAVSLNFRDVAMLTGQYPTEAGEASIPCSDCAAEVVSTGSAVTEIKKGDRVSVVLDTAHLAGMEDSPINALGRHVAGVLREFAIYEDKLLVKLPEYMTWEEGATLACAGVTAWKAINALASTSNARSILFQGTGGVSMFGLLLCLAAGIRPIITSSSNEKLESLRNLSSEICCINYRATSDVTAEVLRITDGKGVDVVVNNTGPASIITDIDMLRQRGGIISLVGLLDTSKAEWDPSAIMTLMRKSASLKGITVGSKVDFEDLNEFMQQNKVQLGPAIDLVFPFHESKAAFDYLLSGKHVGKVIIKIPE